MDLPENQIICGDCLEVMKDWPDNCENISILTDPVWPDCNAGLAGQAEAYDLWQWFLCVIPPTAQRLGVHLGCNSNPEFLKNTSKHFPFFRVATLEYTRPHYLGRLLYNNDVGYLYGEPPKSKPGQHVIPGVCKDTSSTGKEADHPCPRKISHALWFVKWWSEENDIILDPFCGSGTTCVAAKMLGSRYIGIDISEEYCQIARQRLEAIDTGVPVKEQRKGQQALFA
jgi:site-specific DNA-methyltransferase (adenine-specific)/modification methylase